MTRVFRIKPQHKDRFFLSFDGGWCLAPVDGALRVHRVDRRWRRRAEAGAVYVLAPADQAEEAASCYAPPEVQRAARWYYVDSDSLAACFGETRAEEASV